MLVCISLLAPVIAAAADQADGLTQLADGVYVHQVEPETNAVANAGIILLDNGVLVFDTHFTAEAGEALLKKIGALSSKPILYAVNSHFHPDHTHGNQVFGPDVLMISSTATRRDILQRDLPALNRAVAAAQAQIEKMRKQVAQTGDPAARSAVNAQIAARQELLNRMTRLRIIAPAVTFDDELLITEGKRQVSLRHLGVGHTDGDCILYLPAEKIAFVGDLFFQKALPSSQDATLLEWVMTLRELLKLDVEKYVPGHGAVGTKEDVRDFLGYLEELRLLVEQGLARGKTLEQLVAEAQVPAKYAGYRFQNFFPANIQKMYHELKARQAAKGPSADGERKPPPEKP